MVLEIAQFDVTPGAEDAMTESYARAMPLVSQSEGCRWMRMTRGVESPSRFVLLVEWDSVEAHERFRSSERFGQWRALVGRHFAAPPQVEHFRDL